MEDKIELKSMAAYKALQEETKIKINSIKDSKVKEEVEALVKLYTEKKTFILGKEFFKLVEDAFNNINELEGAKEDNTKFSQFQKVLFNEITIWQTKTKPDLKKQIEDGEKK